MPQIATITMAAMANTMNVKSGCQTLLGILNILFSIFISLYHFGGLPVAVFIIFLPLHTLQLLWSFSPL